MKQYIYYSPHIITLAGLAFAAQALISVLEQHYISAARFCLLVLLVDRIDGTLARKLKVEEKFPGTSGEILDNITDLVGLTFVPMVLFWKEGIFLNGIGPHLLIATTVTASWKYSRKEHFLSEGFSIGAPPIFFSIFLFYFLELPPVYSTVYTIILVILCVSPIKFPITSLVTTHWKLGYKSITNYLNAAFFLPIFILLKSTPSIVFWIMLFVIGLQLFVYPLLLNFGIIKPVFDREN
jgi:phosphatidylcholine synthase